MTLAEAHGSLTVHWAVGSTARRPQIPRNGHGGGLCRPRRPCRSGPGETLDNFGVWGRSELAVGVLAETNNANAPALEARSLQLNGQAAKFDGHVYVTGTIKVEQDIVFLNAGDSRRSSRSMMRSTPIRGR